MKVWTGYSRHGDPQLAKKGAPAIQVRSPDFAHSLAVGQHVTTWF